MQGNKSIIDNKAILLFIFKALDIEVEPFFNLDAKFCKVEKGAVTSTPLPSYFEAYLILF